MGQGALDAALQGRALPIAPVQPKRSAKYLRSVLIARIYEVFPLLCPLRGGLVHHRVHHAQRRDLANTRSHRGGV